MLEKVRDYFENELRQAEADITRPWITKTEAVWYAVQRCLGVADFVTRLGVSYTDVVPLFEEYREKLNELLTK
jgi:hypothetical protein